MPIAWLLDALTLQQVLVVAAISGTATVFFDVAYQSYLPTLVDRSQIVDGNGRLEMSRAVAQVAGPGITGVLLRWLGAPLLLAGDALSFLLSALFIGRIRQPDAVPDRSTRRPLRAEIAEGLSFVLRHPLLRRIVACTGTSNLFSAMTGSLLVLFALRTPACPRAPSASCSPPARSAASSGRSPLQASRGGWGRAGRSRWRSSWCCRSPR